MVKVLDSEIINRMVRRKGSGGVGGGGGGSDIDLTGYATKSWTDDNYVGKEFFSSLFKAYDANGNEVLPNDTETVIDNIKAMFGFWTDFYVSALGTGGQSTVGLRLAQLADVNVAGVTNGQVLTYSVDPTTQEGKWVPSTPQAGTDMTTVWSNLAANGNQQINYSHLSGAVSLSNGTITIGSSSITPAVGSFLPLSGGEVTGTLVLSKTQDASGSADNGPALVVGGTRSQAHIEIDNNEIIAKSNASTPSDLYLNSEGGSVFMNNIYVTGGNEINCGSYDGLYLQYRESQGLFLCIGGGNVGIGTNSPSHKLHVNGGIYSTSYVTALSDARHKNIQGDVALTVEMVAKAPAVKFTWKDEKKPGMFVGSLAQYWQKVLPEVVQSQADGTLSLDYQVTALIAAIVTARKVEDHESRLRRLEKMFALNDNDLEE